MTTALPTPMPDASPATVTIAKLADVDELAALEALALADDLDAVRACEQVYERFVGALASADVSALLAGAPEPIHALQHGLSQRDVLLDEAESIAAARWTLRQLARSPQGQRLLLDSLNNWRDDTQRVGIRVQWTLAGTLLLLMATTEVDYGPEGLRIHKKTVIPAQIEALWPSSRPS
jgi:hypothetical protein